MRGLYIEFNQANTKQLEALKKIRPDCSIALDFYVGQESEGQLVLWDNENHLYFFGVAVIKYVVGFAKIDTMQTCVMHAHGPSKIHDTSYFHPFVSFFFLELYPQKKIFIKCVVQILCP